MGYYYYVCMLHSIICKNKVQPTRTEREEKKRERKNTVEKGGGYTVEEGGQGEGRKNVEKGTTREEEKINYSDGFRLKYIIVSSFFPPSSLPPLFPLLLSPSSPLLLLSYSYYSTTTVLLLYILYNVNMSDEKVSSSENIDEI